MIIKVGSEFSKTFTTIGIRIPKVPQEVPVAKARKPSDQEYIAGRKFIRLPAADSVAICTKSAAPRLSVMDFKVQAKVRIRIARNHGLKAFRYTFHTGAEHQDSSCAVKDHCDNRAIRLPMERAMEASL